MNAKTGFWSAFGAFVGGAIGATAGKYATQARPRQQATPAGTEIEDAMVIGGAAGVMLGSFFGAAVAAPEEAPKPKLTA
jgi:hypothetical protein